MKRLRATPDASADPALPRGELERTHEQIEAGYREFCRRHGLKTPSNWQQMSMRQKRAMSQFLAP